MANIPNIPNAPRVPPPPRVPTPTLPQMPSMEPRPSLFTRFFNWLTSRAVVRFVLFLLVTALLVLLLLTLWYVNYRYRLETDLLSPFPEAHPFWLPLLFVLLLLGGYLAWLFFKLLTDPKTGEFPDIEDAWRDGLLALEQAGIDPAEVPLFVVVGKPETSAADFFAATKLPLAVRAEPRRADAPVRVYATRTAVFVTAEGASVTARLADLLARQKAAADAPPAGPVNLLDTPESPVDVLAGEPGPPTIADGESLPMAQEDDWPPAPGSGGAGLPPDEVKRFAARLNYLCRLIGERRRPFAPANGAIFLLPIAGTTADELADQVAAAARADLLAAEAGLQVYCPNVAVVCDAQELTGFRDLLRGLPEPMARERLLGRAFPLVPGVSAEQVPGAIFGAMDWMARHLVPGVVFQRFGSEAEGNGERWSEPNARLWSLTEEVFARRGAIARMVGQGLGDASTRPPMLAGAYLAGTGPDEQDQAFAAGVVTQLLSLQNNVAWTVPAEAEERDYYRMAAIGYAAVVALLLSVMVFGYLTWSR